MLAILLIGHPLTEVPTKEFASLNKSASPTSTNIAPSGTGGIVPRVNKKSSIDSATCTSVLFEDYWCVNWAYDYSADPGAGGTGADSHDYAPFFLDLNDGSKEFCLSLEKANCSSWAAATPTQPGYPTWSPTITSPCCNSYCEIQVSAVQMFYWPTPASVPNITTFVGQTDLPSKLKPDRLIQLLVYICFSTSPSVYLVYKGISATGDCGSGGPSGTIGFSHASLTLSYAQSEIKSYSTAPYQLDVQTVNFALIFPNYS